MKAKKFRIGNVVKYDNRIFTIHTIADEFPTLDTIEFGIGVVDWNNLEPIKLTEDWLKELGFKYNTKFMVFENGDVDLDTDYESTPTYIFKPNGLETKIKYVHELQNLFFALTGTELEIETLA